MVAAGQLYVTLTISGKDYELKTFSLCIFLQSLRACYLNMRYRFTPHTKQKWTVVIDAGNVTH